MPNPLFANTQAGVRTAYVSTDSSIFKLSKFMQKFLGKSKKKRKVVRRSKK